MKYLPLFATLFSFSYCCTLQASTPTELKTLTHKIADIKATLSQDQNKRSHYIEELKNTELSSGKVQLRLKKIKADLKKQAISLSQLKKNEALYQQKLKTQQTKLNEQMRVIYLLGRQPYLKMLLNQSDINQVSRMLTYYHYISQEQVIMIHELQNTLDQIKKTQHTILTQTQQSKKLKTQQENQQKKLKRITQDRQHIIKKINAKIQTKNEKLTTLLENKKQLDHAITQLKKHETTGKKGTFTHLKGHLPWPTRGHILRYFGLPIQHSELTWAGILIEAPENQPVHAIAAGKVIFAKWMPGYGLLIIVDHDNGYMTLYGRNHNLYKKPGDTVKQGDVIASVGQSGGYSTSALYFAIRHNAKALNPVQWCTSTPSKSNH